MKSLKSIFKTTLALSALALPISQDVNAATFRYKFKVASSGLDIYACNAGVLSQSTQLVCVDKKTGQSYVGASAKKYAESCSTAKGNCESNIICNQDLGSTFINGLSAQIISYDNFSAGGKNFSDKTAYASQKNLWSSVVSEKDAKNTFMGDLSFMFMTEMYNAKYFVDICVRAPMNLMKGKLDTSFVLSQRASDVPLLYTGKTIPGQSDRTGTVLDESLSNYIKKAGVKVEGYIACDTTTADPSTANIEFVIGGDGVTPVSAGGKYFSPSNSSTLMNGTEILIQSTQVTNPSFCKVRYVFTETSLTSFRKNKVEGAEMCTFTEFVDPITNESTGTIESK